MKVKCINDNYNFNSLNHTVSQTLLQCSNGDFCVLVFNPKYGNHTLFNISTEKVYDIDNEKLKGLTFRELKSGEGIEWTA